MSTNDKGTATAQTQHEQADADARKAAAEARSAEVTAKIDEETADATAAQKIAEANKAAAAARQGEISALVPDLSKVDRGALNVTGDQALFGYALADMALEAVGRKIATTVAGAVGDLTKARILVTNDAQLATSDAAYLAVTTGTSQLEAAADSLLPPEKMEIAAGAAMDVWAAIAQAVPAVLSLASAHRSVSTAALSVSDLGSSAAVAGALTKEGIQGVVHDDVRLLAPGTVHAGLEDLADRRQRLMAYRGTLTQKKTGADKEQTAALNDTIAQIDSLVAAVDAFVGSINTVPSGATRSTLTLAVMREQLHGTVDAGQNSPPHYTHVLLITGSAGSTQQAISDRPLWFKDKFSVVAVASVSYMLIETGTSNVIAAACESAPAQGSGTIGSTISFHAT